MTKRTSHARAQGRRAMKIGVLAVIVGFGLTTGGSVASAQDVERHDPASAANAAAATGEDADAVINAGPWAAGWAWGNEPETLSYTPNVNYQHNSSGGTNTITRADVGVYNVRFPGLGRKGGIAHVTPYGLASAHCAIGSWGQSGGAEVVQVRCYDMGGTPADRQFVVSFTNAKLDTFTGDVAYAWANLPSQEGSYRPSTRYQFDSAGGKIKITRTEPGAYTVRMPNLGEASGTVKVSSYGLDANRCRVQRWGPDASALEVKVRCMDPLGTPADTQFTITYTDGQSLFANNALRDGYVWGDKPVAASYTPDPLYSFNSLAGTNTIVRLEKGRYRVTLPGIATTSNRGTVQVSAYGLDTNHCQVEIWDAFPEAPADQVVDVLCRNVSGMAANSYFTMQYATTP